jgi:hypothetical protein
MLPTPEPQTYHAIYPQPKGGAVQTVAYRSRQLALEEIENPELAMERMKALYEAKGDP